MKILIVEDDKSLARSMKIVLALEGYEVKVVNDGQDIIPLLCSTVYKPDAVILDLHLPHIDGDELLLGITDHWPSTKVYIFSGFVSDHAGKIHAAEHTGQIKGTFTKGRHSLVDIMAQLEEDSF